MVIVVCLCSCALCICVSEEGGRERGWEERVGQVVVVGGGGADVLDTRVYPDRQRIVRAMPCGQDPTALYLRAGACG